MDVRADFARREVVRPTDQIWSPFADGVEQCTLDRTAARETAFLRCAAGARLEREAATNGEELLVLAGDLDGASAGTYLRDPLGKPRTAGPDGALLFAKRNQFAADDRRGALIDSRAARFRPGAPGLSVLPVHEHGTESTAIIRWAPMTRFTLHRHWGGEEMLVLEGQFEDEHGAYPAGTWIRNPHLSTHDPFIKIGALVFVKTGHLPTP